MMFIHIAMGSLGILSGFAAMAFAKGSPAHRLAGRVYVGSMLAMTVSAFIIALFIKPLMLNVLAASLTFYLVATAWMTMHRRPEQPGGLEFAALVMGVAVAVAGFSFGYLASVSPKGAFDRGFPAGIYYFFAIVAALAAAFDLKLLLRRTITRTQKLVRHLWRMGFTLWVAAASLFIGQAKHLPEWLTGPKLNVIPVLLSLGLLVFWLIRVRFPPWSRKSRSGGQTESLAPAP